MSDDRCIVFYDIYSALHPRAWSPNTWKARLALNYKGVPYKTVWLSYPDIEPTLRELGAQPTGTKPRSSDPYYTLPIILVPNANGEAPTIISDSLAITEYLEEKYPEKPIFPKLGKAMEYAFAKYFETNIYSCIGPVLRLSTWKVLDERGQEYWRTTREKWAEGKKLEEFSPEGEVRDGHWKVIQGVFTDVATILAKNGDNVDFAAGGEQPTRADFVMVAVLIWLKTILGAEWEERGVELWDNGRWGKLLKRTEQWQVVV